MNDLNFSRDGAAIAAPAGLGGSDSNARPARLLPLLSQYIAIARRRRWVIIGALITALLVSLLVTLLMTPQYTARITLEIQRESNNIVKVQGVEPETGLGDMEFYQTQYGLIQSRSLAESVATDLRLYDDPTFFALFGLAEAEGWFEGGRVTSEAPNRDYRIRKAADILLANLTLAPVRLSRLVHVEFTSPDPAFSAKIVNAWGEHFIQTTFQRRFEATAYARDFLEGRLEQLRGRLDESERRLVAYAARQGIVNLPSPDGSAGAERSVVADNLAALNRELAAATADKVQALSRLRAPGGAVTEALENQAISGLRQKRAELASEYAKLMAQFEPSYPPAEALQDQIRQLERAIAREEARVASSLEATYQASARREANLSQRVEGLQEDLLDYRRRSIQYNIFQRDVDTNRQLYDALLQRYKEIGVAGGVGVNNISVVDSARVPQAPSSPRVVLNILLSLLIGGVVGAGLALALEQIDDAVSDPSELERELDVALLGVVPKSRGDDALEMLEDRKSEVSEAYLAIQTSLSFCTDHGMPHSLTVTSTRPAEGKSTTAYAIAKSLVRSGRKVVLVDADMRAPSVHLNSGLGNEAGLSNYLAGNDNLDDFIHRGAPGDVAILSAGPQPPNAAELLSSDRLELLLRLLREKFDHVVIDSPPVMGLADAPLLASKTEGTVFVIESHTTRIGQAKLALGRIAAAQAHVLGAVLTKFQSKQASYGYGYEYGYSYGRAAGEPA